MKQGVASLLIFPPGFEGWTCPVCMAQCNYEAMYMCAKIRASDVVGTRCGFDEEKPESNGGCFEFMVKVKEEEKTE